MKVARFSTTPIVHPDIDGRMGDNINGPSLIRAPNWLPSPIGRYYLYFGHHDGAAYSAGSTPTIWPIPGAATRRAPSRWSLRVRSLLGRSPRCRPSLPTQAATVRCGCAFGWMRIRGCDRRACGEMSAVMLLPTVAALMRRALELHDAQLWVSSNQHTLMLVAMLAVMLYRREHYTRG
jgi:hypothetical protein